MLLNHLLKLVKNNVFTGEEAEKAIQIFINREIEEGFAEYVNMEHYQRMTSTFLFLVMFTKKKSVNTLILMR